jgi:hypothetical protein
VTDLDDLDSRLRGILVGEPVMGVNSSRSLQN